MKPIFYLYLVVLLACSGCCSFYKPKPTLEPKPETKPATTTEQSVSQPSKVPTPPGSSPKFQKTAVTPQQPGRYLFSLNTNLSNKAAYLLFRGKMRDNLSSLEKALFAFLHKKQFHRHLPEALSHYWKQANPQQRDKLLEHAFNNAPYSRAASASKPWKIQYWLLTANFSKKDDLRLLETKFLSASSPVKTIIRDYLYQKYNRNYGRNYLSWKQFLQN